MNKKTKRVANAQLSFDDQVRGLTVVVGGKKLSFEHTKLIVPLVNDHHDGVMTHGQLIAAINRMYHTEDVEES